MRVMVRIFMYIYSASADLKMLVCGYENVCSIGSFKAVVMTTYSVEGNTTGHKHSGQGWGGGAGIRGAFTRCH